MIKQNEEYLNSWCAINADGSIVRGFQSRKELEEFLKENPDWEETIYAVWVCPNCGSSHSIDYGDSLYCPYCEWMEDEFEEFDWMKEWRGE